MGTEIVMRNVIYSNVYAVPNVRDGLIGGITVRITFVDETDKSRVEIHSSIDFLKGLRDQVDAVLRQLDGVL